MSPLLSGWRRLTERVKSSAKVRRSQWIQSGRRTADFTSVKPVMRLGLQNHSKPRLTSHVSRLIITPTKMTNHIRGFHIFNERQRIAHFKWSLIDAKRTSLLVQLFTLYDLWTLYLEYVHKFCFFSLSLELPRSDGPKQTKVSSTAERLLSDGRRFVTLSCITKSNPPATQYFWYRKTEDNEEATAISEKQNYTVYSDKPGIYYCIAKNKINGSLSEPIELFLDREWIQSCMCAVYSFYQTCLCRSLWTYAN